MSKEKREEAGLISVRYVKRMEDVICVPGQPPPIGDVLVCTGFGCVPCPPEGDKEKIKRNEMDLIPMKYVKRVEDVICVPGQPPPIGDVLVCTGVGCVHCPSEADKGNAKRWQHGCIPHCVGEHCACEEEEE